MDNHCITSFATRISKVQKELSSFDSSLYASLLDDRPMGLAIVSAGVLHTGLVMLGFPSWSCPIREFLGLPCPGCGISRSIAALLYGDWETSLETHAFGPFFLLAVGLIGIVNLLPSLQRYQFVHLVKIFEQKTGFTAVFLIILVLYWLSRIIFFRDSYYGLVMS